MNFDALLDAIGDGVPNPEQYKLMSNMPLHFPEARALAHLDPFSPAYREAALKLYFSLRGGAERGYVATRDEVSTPALPENLASGFTPWSSRDANTVSEHLFAWGNILGHLNLPPGGSVLEYGPGSGQILLMLARLGYRAHGVDIDAMALEGIQAQAAQLDIAVATDCAAFGHGFAGQRFDRILFYEAFHHAIEFEDLLLRLHRRLNPGGKIILCGEPIVAAPCDAVPYPWGPRLDALSVFCMRRYGWMELGFSHDFLMTVARATGWMATHHRFRKCPRAALYVLEQASPDGLPAAFSDCNEQLRSQHLLAMDRASATWRRTWPIRATKNLLVDCLRAARKVARRATPAR